MGKNTKNVYYNGIFFGELDATGNTDVDLERVRTLLAEKGVDVSPPAAEGTRRQAVHFAAAAHHLYQISGMDGERPVRDPSAAVAFVVNGALAAELFLKSLLQADGQEKKNVHGLLSIYDKLSDAMRTHVERCATQLALGVRLATVPGVRDTIEMIDSAFVDWRYAHEREHTGLVVGGSVGFLLETLNIAAHLAAGSMDQK